MSLVADKPRKGRPPKAESEKVGRAGKSYQAYYDGDLWSRLEAYMASLRIPGDYKDHIEAALDDYLSKLGFPGDDE